MKCNGRISLTLATVNANAAAAAANRNYTMGEIVGAIPAGCAVPVGTGPPTTFAAIHGSPRLTVQTVCTTASYQRPSQRASPNTVRIAARRLSPRTKGEFQ